MQVTRHLSLASWCEARREKCSSLASIRLNSQWYHANLALGIIWKQCLLCSKTWADDPAASLRVIGFSGDVTVRSKAAGFPRSQFGTRTSASLVRCRHAPNHFLLQFPPPTLACLQNSKKVFLRPLWHDATSPLHLQVRP